MSKMPTKNSRNGFISAQLQKGQALIEYALILALGVVGLVAILTITAPAVGNVFSNTVYNLLGQTTTPQEPLDPTEFWELVTSVASYTPESPPLTPNTPIPDTAEPSDTPIPSDTPSPMPTFTPEDTATPGPSPTPEDTDYDYPFEDDATDEDAFYDEDPDETSGNGPWGVTFWDWSGTGNGNCNFGNIFDPNTGDTSVQAKEGDIDADIIDFFWGGSPVSGVDSNFCSRFELDMELEAGDYEINYVKDDGIRVFIDDGSSVDRVVNDWAWDPNNANPQRVTFNNPTTRNVTVRVIHFDNGGNGRLQFALNKDGEGSSTTCNWELDSSRRRSAPTSWHDSVGGNYRDNTSCSLVLRGTINLTSAAEPKLIFYSAYNLANFDDAKVGVSVAGSSVWREMTIHSGGSTNYTFTRQEVDLLNFVADDGNSYDFTGERIELRFTLDADGNSTADGWWIDDIEIEEVPEPVYYVDLFRDDAERTYPNDELDIYWDREDTWSITTEQARSGTRSWTDRPGANYLNNSNTALQLNGRIDLSSTSPTTVTDPEVAFWHRYNMDPTDRLYVEASLDKANWTIMQTISVDGSQPEGTALVTGGAENPEWSLVRAEFPDAMVGEAAVYLRFRLQSDGSTNDPGWWIDDIELRNKPDASVSNTYCDNFDGGFGNWIASGDWAIVSDVVRGGTGAMHDSPGGDYDNLSNYSVEFVPYLDLSTGFTRPVIEFWHRWELERDYDANDKYIVEVSDDDGVSWQQVFFYEDEESFPGNDPVSLNNWGRYDYNQGWKREVIELSSFLGFPSQPSDPPGLKVRFRIDATQNGGGRDTGDGWWIDDLCFIDMVPRVVSVPFADDMDAGNNNWIPGNNWENVNNERERSGSAWSDSPGSGGGQDYQDWHWSILELAPTVDLSATTNPALYYWVYTALNDGDRFQVEYIETDVNGRPFTDWAILPNTRVNGDFENRAFTRYETDLTPHVGKYIRIRFVMDSLSGGDRDDGVHLDDLRIIDRALEEIVYPPNYSENVELLGFGEWVLEHEWDGVLVTRDNILPPGQWTATWYDGLRDENGPIEPGDCRNPTLELDPTTATGIQTQHNEIDFNWGNGFQSGVGLTHSDYWGARFERVVFFENETTVDFAGYSNNGMRILVDGNIVADYAFNGWNGQSNGCFYNDLSDAGQPPYTFSAGVHVITIEYYEASGSAQLQIDFSAETQVLHDSPGGNYNEEINTVAELEGQIDLTSYGAGDNPVLTWDHRYQVHWTDQMYVEVSTDGGFTWTSVFSDDGTDWDWETGLADLTPYVGQLINIRFRLEVLNTDTEQDGWWIDNIEIRN